MTDKQVNISEFAANTIRDMHNQIRPHQPVVSSRLSFLNSAMLQNEVAHGQGAYIGMPQ
jgi:hypothetical protein